MTNSKSSDTRLVTKEFLDAYLEMAFAAMALRIPVVHKYLMGHFPSASVASSYPGQAIIIHSKVILGEIEREGLTEIASLRRAFNQINRIFISAMWDTLNSHVTYDKIATEPDIQFFRHIRNACAHNGTFNFTELRHAAVWRDKEITMELAGKAVSPEFMKDGDPVLLMLDINNRYFHPVGVPGYVSGNEP